MAKKKSKKWVLILLILLLLGLVFSVCYICLQKEKEKVVSDTEDLDDVDYSATEEMEKALRKLEEQPEKAQVITDINTVEKEVALCFEGTTDGLVIRQILDYLDEHDMQATFFISAVDAGEDEDTVDMILEAGYEMESYTLYGTTHMETYTQEELVEDFCRAQAVYEDKIGIVPTILKCNATDYTEEIMEAADACGYDSMVYSTHYLNYSSFYSEEMAHNYVQNMGKGSIISIKLGGYLDELEYEETKTDEEPAKDKQPGLELHDLEEEELTEDERLLQVVEWLLDALDEAEYEAVPVSAFPSQDMGDLVLKFEEMEEQYAEEKAEIIKTVHTTDRECSFIFRGIEDEKELTNLLAVLEEIEAKATFFVTGAEIEKYPTLVQQIIDAGHEIGSSGYLGKSMADMSFGEICEDIYKNDLLLEDLGIETDLFMAPYGEETEAIQMAAAAMDKKIIGYTDSPTRSEYVEKGYTAEEAVRKYYPDSKKALCRGEIVYFNMRIYDDENSLAEMVKAVWQAEILPTQYGTREGHILQVSTISSLLDRVWYYPAVTNASYHAIKPENNMQFSWEEGLANHYIGNVYYGNNYLRQHGFAESELDYIDKTGRVDTGGTNTVFLTFDDWGDETTIGKILYVLRKHNIKATFFIKTDYVVNGSGENLLRAIAEEGHDIGSHTNTHMPISITEDQISVLQQDLTDSNHVLANVVGNTGSLTTYFRPPTLASSRIGVQTAFGCGYTQIVGADISTGDYKATSVEEVYDTLLNGVPADDGESEPERIQDGSIVVMHISTNSIYTPQGLDRYLNYIDSLPEGDPNKFNFGKLSDYLH